MHFWWLIAKKLFIIIFLNPTGHLTWEFKGQKGVNMQKGLSQRISSFTRYNVVISGWDVVSRVTIEVPPGESYVDAVCRVSYPDFDATFREEYARVLVKPDENEGNVLIL